MLLDYLKAAMRHAHYEMLSDDGTFFGEIPECNGVYANSSRLEACVGMNWKKCLRNGFCLGFTKTLLSPLLMDARFLFWKPLKYGNTGVIS